MRPKPNKLVDDTMASSIEIDKVTSTVTKRCLELIELVTLINWYMARETGEIVELSEVSIKDMYRVNVSYAIYLDAQSDKIQVIIDDLSSHFDWNDEDLKEIVERLKRYR